MDKVRAEDPTHLEDIRTEIDIFGSLDHPYICRFFRAIETDAQVIIAMEYLDGGTLLDYMNAKAELPEAEIHAYFAQIISAISYLHTNIVCHRDLRLENLCFDSRHNLKVVDFGLSCRFNPARPLMDVPCGCPSYGAPEVFLRGDYTPLVDIWSAGVILYTLAVGRLPFPGNTPDEVLTYIGGQGPSFPAFLSDALIDLLRQILVREPANRFWVADIQTHPWMAAATALGAPSGGGGKRRVSWWQRVKAKFRRKEKKPKPEKPVGKKQKEDVTTLLLDVATDTRSIMNEMRSKRRQ
jgi:serine/threonine protein kinase